MQLRKEVYPLKVVLYNGQKHSINEIRSILGLPVNYLYRISRNEKKIRCMDIDNLKQIARLEGLEPEELREKMLKKIREERYEL
jgi:16S rRNA U516 pseudouridylate synthase RsuA-like enzyme